MDKYEERFFSIDVRADDNGGFNSSTELLVSGYLGSMMIREEGENARLELNENNNKRE